MLFSDEVRLHINKNICDNIFRLEYGVVIPGVQFKNSVKYILVATQGQNLIKTCIWINFIAYVIGHNETNM